MVVVHILLIIKKSAYDVRMPLCLIVLTS